MSDKRIQLLLSAHDPAAADAITRVVEVANCDKRFKCKVIAHGPAVEIFRKANVSVQSIDAPRVQSSIEDNTKHLLMLASNLIDEYNPDVIITGLSGPDAGIDEALAAVGKGRVPVFALQDFWGDVNPVFDVSADYFLVADSFAANITKQKINAEVIEVGMPRYSKLSDLPERELCRNQLGFKDKSISFIWFGQPLWKQVSYEQTLVLLADVLTTIKDDINFMYRPHPRENYEEIQKAQNIFNDILIDTSIHEEMDNRYLFVSGDIVASAYSMIAMDIIQFQRQHSCRLASPMYFFGDNILMKNYYDYTGLDCLPLVEQGLVYLGVGAKEMQEGIRTVVQQNYIDDYRNKVKQVVPDSSKSVSRILDVIYKVH
jgi:hypothetical protein